MPLKRSAKRAGRASAAAAKPTFFVDAAAFRAWLERHHASATELLVGFHKVGSGRPSISWPESVDEALCFGWIDGLRKRIDAEAYQIRFSPRRKGSIWSAINVAKMKDLIAAGKARPPGIAAYEVRSDRKTGIYSFEQQRPVELLASERRQFSKHVKAWKYFEALPPGYKRTIIYWVVSAKQRETRGRRRQQLIDACGEQRRLLK